MVTMGNEIEAAAVDRSAIHNHFASHDQIGNVNLSAAEAMMVETLVDSLAASCRDVKR
jgi:hypothetical protein